MADLDGPPVPEDLRVLGWRTKQSRGHPGHFYYYNEKTKESFWKLSQAYAAVELQRRKEVATKVKTTSCAKSTLRLTSIFLVVLGLMVSFFISFVCYHDRLNVLNVSVVLIGGFVVVVHTLMAPWLLDSYHVLMVYVPVAVIFWIYETLLFIFALMLKSGDAETREQFAALDAKAGGGFARQFMFTPTFAAAMESKGKIILIFAITLWIFQLLAWWYAGNRRNELRDLEDSEEGGAAEAQHLKQRAAPKTAMSNTSSGGQTGANDAESDKLMNMYDSLFRQYGMDPPEFMDSESVSSSDTITTNNHADHMSVGSRHSRKSSRGGRR